MTQCETPALRLGWIKRTQSFTSGLFRSLARWRSDRITLVDSFLVILPPKGMGARKPDGHRPLTTTPSCIIGRDDEPPESPLWIPGRCRGHCFKGTLGKGLSIPSMVYLTVKQTGDFPMVHINGGSD